MPKADPSTNYYAVLEISPTSSAADIKKQFYKLALLYHPDRNPGRESEYKDRFQAIQEAHEILSDEDERARYDSRRRVMNLNGGGNANPASNQSFRRPAPGRNNPYQATSNFPPPPSRTNPRREVPTPTARSGAERYSQWNPPAPAPPPTPPRRGAGTGPREPNFKADSAWTAWQQMNHAQRQAFRQNGNVHNVPPVYTPPTQQRPVPPPPTESRWYQNPSNSSPPRAVPEQGSFGAGINRTTSRRGQSRRAGFDPNSPGMDEGPAPGPSNYRSATFGPDSQSAFAPTGRPPNSAPHPDLNKPGNLEEQRSRSNEDVFVAERVSKGKGSYSAGTHYFEKDKLRRSSSFEDPKNPFPSSHNFQDDRRRSDATTMPPPPRPHMEIHSDDEESSYMSDGSDEIETKQNISPRSTPNPDKGPSKGGHKLRFDLPKDHMARSSNPELRSPSKERPGVSPLAQSKDDDPYSRPLRSASIPNNIFKLQSQGTQPPSPSHPMPKPASDEPTFASGAPFAADKFKDQDWTSGWAPDPSQGQTTTSRASPTRKTRVTSQRSGAGDSTSKPVTPQPATFEEEERGDPQWFTGHLTEEEKEERRRRNESKNYPRRDEVDDLDPMDVDPEPPANAPAAPHVTVEDTSAANKGPRPVYTVPLRPEWQPRASDGFERRSSVPYTYSSSQNQQGASAAPFSSGPTPPVQPPSNFDMDSFRNVAPFQPVKLGEGKNGLQTMKGDMIADLPFTSGASSATSSRIFLPLPNPPAAPATPSHLTGASYQLYLSELSRYMQSWHQFYKAMSVRFNTHAAELAAFSSPNSSSPNNPQSQYFAGPSAGISLPGPGILPFWLSAPGETEMQKGWPTYRALVKEDAKMRAHLNVACEKHLVAVEEHEKLRIRAEKLNQREAREVMSGLT